MSNSSEIPTVPESQATMTMLSNAAITEQADQALLNLERSDRREHRVRAGVAGSFLATGAVAAWGVASGAASQIRFNHPMPYIESAQQAINNVDNVLEVVGIGAFIAGIAGIAAVKIGAPLDTRLHVLDQWSSRDMSEDRLNPNRSLTKRALEATFAGRIPVMASIGAGLAVFSTAISTEVSNGPQRPIEKAFTAFAPGNTMVVGYDGAMPMVQSAVPRKLANDLLATAKAQNMQAEILDEHLGVLSKGTQNLPELTIGVQFPANHPLSWGVDSSCNNIPIGIDKGAGIDFGEKLYINGSSAVVAEELEGISATNRVGVVVAQEVIANCFNHNADAPVHSVVFDAPVEQVTAMVKTVNNDATPYAVITKQHYLHNSQKFWESNVKPITSVLALFAGVFASAVAGSRIRESMVRNRREWAAKLANGNSQAMIRATEITRVTKDGVLATVIGGAGATIATPFVVNTLESGFQASVGLKEIAVGSAVAIVGSLVGAVKSLINPKKIIRPEESLRS